MTIGFPYDGGGLSRTWSGRDTMNRSVGLRVAHDVALRTRSAVTSGRTVTMAASPTPTFRRSSSRAKDRRSTRSASGSTAP